MCPSCGYFPAECSNTWLHTTDAKHFLCQGLPWHTFWAPQLHAQYPEFYSLQIMGLASIHCQYIVWLTSKTSKLVYKMNYLILIFNAYFFFQKQLSNMTVRDLNHHVKQSIGAHPPSVSTGKGLGSEVFLVNKLTSVKCQGPCWLWRTNSLKGEKTPS